MLFGVAATVASLLAHTYALPRSGTQWVNLQRLSSRLAPSDAVTKATAAPSFPQFTFTQPLDHFSDTGVTFNQRHNNIRWIA